MSQSGSQEVQVVSSQVVLVDPRVIFVSLGAQQGHDGMVHYRIPHRSLYIYLTLDRDGYTETISFNCIVRGLWNYRCSDCARTMLTFQLRFIIFWDIFGLSSDSADYSDCPQSPCELGGAE